MFSILQASAFSVRSVRALWTLATNADLRLATPLYPLTFYLFTPLSIALSALWLLRACILFRRSPVPSPAHVNLLYRACYIWNLFVAVESHARYILCPAPSRTLAPPVIWQPTQLGSQAVVTLTACVILSLTIDVLPDLSMALVCLTLTLSVVVANTVYCGCKVRRSTLFQYIYIYHVL